MLKRIFAGFLVLYTCLLLKCYTCRQMQSEMCYPGCLWNVALFDLFILQNKIFIGFPIFPKNPICDQIHF